jgi:hypothetical protein
MVFIASPKKDVIFAAVRAMYTDVALHPEREYSSCVSADPAVTTRGPRTTA